ncbi:MAG: response regulator [Candidatus Saccharicenans sp.]|nr:response regulator [Candidatus Saccharicenans sp.]
MNEKKFSSGTALHLSQKEFGQLLDSLKEEIEALTRSADETEGEIIRLVEASLNTLGRIKELRKIVDNLENRISGLEAGEKESSTPADSSLESSAVQERIDRLLTLKGFLEKVLISGESVQAEFYPPPSAETLPGKKVLVVDDDPTTVKIITYLLEKEGIQVVSASSGAEGLKKAFQEKPDLIILDVMMPELNGFQFLNIFRRAEGQTRTPVIFLSSLAEEADVITGLESGAVDYLIKPFSPQVLLTKIKKSLETGR